MRTRPARSVSTFSHLPAGEGATPAVQITVLLAMRSPRDHHAVRVDLIHAVSESDLDAQILKSLLRRLRKMLRKRPENSRCHIDEHNSSRG